MSYPWPSDLFPVVRSRFYVAPHSRTYMSPLNRASLSDRLAGERWVGDIELASMDEATQRQLQAFLSRLDGPSGRVYMGPTGVGGYAGPRGTAITSTATAAFSDTSSFSDGSRFSESRGAGTVFATASRGNDGLTVAGLIANGTIEPGDIIQVGDPFLRTPCQLLECIEPARANNLGRSRLSIRPRLRADVSAGTPVIFINPRGVFRLADDDQNAVDRRQFVASHSLRLVEIV